ncbi:MAG: SPFH domain-containing protein [Ardenticatenales bacterium]
MREIPRTPMAGIPMLVALPAVLLGTVLLMVLAFVAHMIVAGIALLFVVIVEAVMLGGFFMVAPNEAQVLQLFGRYVGTAREPGLRWTNPFYGKRRVSTRVRNFETPKLKVNDNHSNPIEIASVVVWRVVDTAEAMFEVDDYKNYVGVQSESALRSLATGYPYDAHETGQLSLSGNTAEVSEKLKSEIQERLGKAGVEVIEARISHLAYAQEIAAAMLQRQQASAIVAARYKIVEGAVGMVENALEMLAKGKIVELDDERKAAMVSNLLVVLCSDRHAQPVVNAGTLHN